MNEPQFDRVVDHTFAAWVRRRTRSDVLARAAFAVSRDEGQGHSCAALPEDVDASALRAHAWVGDGSAFSPFVLTGRGDFYLWRNWRHESRLAEALRARARVRSHPVDAERLASDVGELFAETDAETTRLQRNAVAAVPGAHVFVLTGGPGTGKTSTVLRMLLMLMRHAEVCGFGAHPSIALAAPTGKAAQRMTQSIAAGRADLAQHLPPASPFRAWLDRVPAAQTLHRLLEYRPHDNQFARGADSPLAADIVVVDETSMVDLAMMRQLIDAVRPNATIILLGDPAQLYAVEAGSVLGDIVASASEGSPLAGHVATLRHVWRAEQALSRDLDRVRGGDVGWVDALTRGDASDAVLFRACVDDKAMRARIETWVDQHAHELASLMHADIAPADALNILRRFQILCAVREGAFGSHGINTAMRDILTRRFRIEAMGQWHHGRPVIVTRNDYARDLYNGDVGIALRGADGLRVWFESRDGASAVRSISARTLPEHEPAWAITIHRSQGSEYGDVAVVLPPESDHRILSRELLYTAMSRAAQGVELWTSAEALRTAIARPVQRRGGLRDKLR